MTQSNPIPGVAAAQTARVSAALAAAGAYDTSPVEMNCQGWQWVMFFIKYTRGGAGGDLQFKPEVSPVGSGDHWYQVGAAVNGSISSGTDLVNNIQRAEVEYGSTGVAAEKVSYGPIFLGGCADRIRLNCQESGATGTPGTVEVLARFS